MKRALILSVLAVSGFLAVVASPSTASAQYASQADLADIKLTGVNYDQEAWMHCEGQTMKILHNEALFALLENTYGGDGRTTFKLPDLREAEKALRKQAGISEHSQFLRYVICVKGNFPSRD